MNQPLSAIAEWQNFYVITGSAAAGLTGLTFVVIALAANRRRVTEQGLRAFVTPTVLHFSSVLALAAFMTVPHLSPLCLSAGFLSGGTAGLIYGCLIAVSLLRVRTHYIPVGEDWLWHFALPTMVYGAFVVLAFQVSTRPEMTLCGAAAASLLLLFIGIHNAWDVAVAMSLGGQDSPGTKDPDPPKDAPSFGEDR